MTEQEDALLLASRQGHCDLVLVSLYFSLIISSQMNMLCTYALILSLE